MLWNTFAQAIRSPFLFFISVFFVLFYYKIRPFLFFTNYPSQPNSPRLEFTMATEANFAPRKTSPYQISPRRKHIVHTFEYVRERMR